QLGNVQGGRLHVSAGGDNADTVAVVVESRLVDQRGADGVGGMDHAAVGGITESCSHRRYVVAAPQRGSILLADRLRYPVPKHLELVCKLLIDANDLFANVGRLFTAADKLRAAIIGCGK